MDLEFEAGKIAATEEQIGHIRAIALMVLEFYSTLIEKQMDPVMARFFTVEFLDNIVNPNRGRG